MVKMMKNGKTALGMVLLAGIVMTLTMSPVQAGYLSVGGMCAAGAACAPTTTGGDGPAVGDFTYLGGSPTKWEPGPNKAAFHPFVPPAGAGTPGGATWSVMPAGTLSDAFDPHAAAGTATTSAGAGGLIAAASAAFGTELAVYGAALSQWASVSGFTNLGMVADGGAAFNTPEPGGIGVNTLFGDIRIGAIGFAGPLGVLAHASQPGTSAEFAGTPTIGGDVHMDNAEVWIDAAVDAAVAGGIDFYSVVLHELGHALGLGHTTTPGSVMFASIATNTTNRVFSADDIAGIQAIYGPAPAGVPEPTTLLLLSFGLAGLSVSRFRK